MKIGTEIKEQQFFDSPQSNDIKESFEDVDLMQKTIEFHLPHYEIPSQSSHQCCTSLAEEKCRQKGGKHLQQLLTQAPIKLTEKMKTKRIKLNFIKCNMMPIGRFRSNYYDLLNIYLCIQIGSTRLAGTSQVLCGLKFEYLQIGFPFRLWSDSRSLNT